MISGHKTLGDYLKERKINIFSGIKTGCNEVFYVTQQQRDEFIAKDPNCSELLVPMLQGKDIQPWEAAHNGTWLILTQNAAERSKTGKPPINIESYPSIHEHLLASKERLMKRGDQGEEWYNLRWCDYYDIFTQPKILYQEIATEQRFVLDTSGLFTNNKVMIIPTDDLFLLGILNSSLAWEFLKAVCSQLQGNTISLQTPSISRLPIPVADENEREKIILLVQRCLEASKDARESIQQELNIEVARLYGISL